MFCLFGNGSLCMIIRYYDTLCYYRQNELAALLWAGAGREHHFSILVGRTDLLLNIESHCHFHVVIDSCLQSTTFVGLGSTATHSVW
jgi:hypothetical protein